MKIKINSDIAISLLKQYNISAENSAGSLKTLVSKRENRPTEYLKQLSSCLYEENSISLCSGLVIGTKVFGVRRLDKMLNVTDYNDENLSLLLAKKLSGRNHRILTIMTVNKKQIISETRISIKHFSNEELIEVANIISKNIKDHYVDPFFSISSDMHKYINKIISRKCVSGLPVKDIYKYI